MRERPPFPIPATASLACAFGTESRLCPFPAHRPSSRHFRLLDCPPKEFTFAGFLPSRPTERRRALRELASEHRTLALYEAPHRLLDTLEDALEILGNRPAVMAREITKAFEEFSRGHIEDLVQAARVKLPRGDYAARRPSGRPGAASRE